MAHALPISRLCFARLKKASTTIEIGNFRIVKKNEQGGEQYLLLT
jgi:hypothetical protein